MDNKNQDQNKSSQNSKVPDDLLILVDHPDSPVQNNESTTYVESGDNIFITDFSDSKVKNSESQITNSKLNVLLGTPSIARVNNLTVSNNKNNNSNNDTGISNNKLNSVDISDNTNNESVKKLDTLMKDTYNYKIELEKKTIRSNKYFLFAAIGSGACFVIVLLFAIFSGGINFSFRGGEAYFQNKSVEKFSEFETAVFTDNIYTNVTVNDKNDAKDLIIKDSNNQKNKCPEEKVKEIESRIEEKYEIVAVNFCELDYDFALELEKVLDNVYKEFPDTIKGFLTNLTLSNMEKDGPIATFIAAKLFAKSNTFTTYPNVYKTSILLNAQYFLDLDNFIATMEYSDDWFVKNATKSSIVAHEFGHYLSFVAQLNNTQSIDQIILLTRKNYSSYSKLIKVSNEGSFSLKIIEEAFENLNNKTPNKYDSIQEFRRSISEYAAAEDDYGDPIYDETIAEAYHDWYLNKQKAKDSSKEIVSVLKKYINN